MIVVIIFRQPLAACFIVLFLIIAEMGGGVAAARSAPPSLQGVTVPLPKGLGNYITDLDAAIRLGKAFFWDAQLSSDGQGTCATCHSHAGADYRIKNTLGPGGQSQRNPKFDPAHGGAPNYTLQFTDFPFHRLADPNQRNSQVIFDTDDVAISLGVFTERFRDVTPGQASESGVPIFDPLFGINGISVRRTAFRNAPSVINAVFNYRTLWDGRGNHIFNGVNTFGAGTGEVVFRAAPDGSVKAVNIGLDFAATASQATGPLLNTSELAYIDRSLPVEGRKVLQLRPLALQRVDPTDSVLGGVAVAGGTGLTASYPEMIKTAFRPEWWSGESVIVRSGDGFFTIAAKPQRPLRPNEFTVMEANFRFFHALSINLYEWTLVSDEAPYDLYAKGDKGALTTAQKRGLDLFLHKGNCIDCHGGPLFSNATVPYIFGVSGHGHPRTVEKIKTADGRTALHDTGFYNIGVRPTAEDIGVGGSDPFGRPFALAKPTSCRRVAVKGSFKVPSLRNVELTGPYFHNGGQATLEQVVQFLNRGGDFRDVNPSDVTAEIKELHLTAQEQSDLVEFLKALTDPRVRYERAPFDHPELTIPHGHEGDTQNVTPDAFGQAVTLYRQIPAVGRDGGPAIRPFADQATGQILVEVP